MRFIEESSPCVSQCDAVAMAHEQRDAELFFQLMYAATERWLRDVQPFGCLGNAQGLSNCDERFHSPEIHGPRIVYQIGIPARPKMYWTACAAVRERIARTRLFEKGNTY